MSAIQTDYFGAAAVDPQIGSTRPRPPSPDPNGPARKIQKRDSDDSGSDGGKDDPSGANSGPTPSGPPFICPTCSTSYSRLEYLRRHERRHADIRPFVCDCGKGFSRSDVLSRHKRQCRVVLQIDGSAEGDAAPEAGDSPPKPAKGRRSSAAKPGRPKGSTKAAKAAASASNGLGENAQSISPAHDDGDYKNDDDQQPSQPQPPPPPPPAHTTDHELQAQDGQQQDTAPQTEEDASAMIDPAIAADSSAHAATSAMSAATSAYAYATGAAPGVEQGTDFNISRLPLYGQGNFAHAPVHSQISALSHQYYQPSSPESNGSIASRSEHGSPRYTSQGLVRHGSNPGSRFGLRTGSFDQYGTRQLGGAAFSSTDASIWEGLDTAKLPSPGHVTTPGAAARASSSLFASLASGFPATSPLSHLTDRSRSSSHLGSDASYFRTGAASLAGSALGGGVGGLAGYNAASGSSPAFSFQTPNSSSAADGSIASSSATNAASSTTAASSVSQGNHPHGEGSGATTPKEPMRFSVATTGPLSPFSVTALNSSMSPYHSAFSNARDTPLVASPRSGLPGTPGALASLDLTGQWSSMRPPSRPISRHNSVHGLATSANSNGGSGSTQTSPKSESGKLPKSASNEKLNVGDSSSVSSTSSSSSSNGLRTSTTSTALTGAGSGAGSEVVDKGHANGGAGSKSAGSSTGQAAGATGTSGSVSTSVAGSTTAAAPSGFSGLAGGGTDTPSRFVKNEASQHYFDGGALTPGPEAFLLRVQGGAQELRAGITSFENAVFGPTSALGGTPLGFSQNSTPGWDASILASAGGSNGIGSQSSNNALGWLTSPSIQQLFSASLNGSSKDDYFSMSSAMDVDIGGLDQGGGVGVGVMPSSAGGLGGVGVGLSAKTTAEMHKSILLDADINSAALERALTDAKNPFFIPPHMFRPCYSISHWNLPPLTRLSMLAHHAQQNLLKHFPVIHEPTFRLDTTPGCVAFSVCMLGCHEAGRKWWAGEEVVPKTVSNVINGMKATVTEPEMELVRTRAEQVEDREPSKFIDEEDGQELVKPIVMTEKMDMLMRSFASRCKSTKDKCAVVQALMLYQSNSFLSSDPATRTIAAISHGSVVTLARQAGFFDAKAEHARREVSYTGQEVANKVAFEAADLCFSYSFLPSYLPNCPDEEKVWRRWAELEGRRRTAFVIFLMDTVASLDAGIPTLLKVEEVAHLPLPSPDQLWRAASSSEWRSSLESYQGPTLDAALHQLLSHDGQVPGPRGDRMGCSIYGLHGPFARLVMIISLLRGIIDMLEGRALKVARPSPLQPWLGNSLEDGRWSPEAHVSIFKRALSRWRKAWDLDESCRSASSPMVAQPPSRPQDQDTPFTPLTASGATPLCDDALPLYWLGHVLVTHAASDQKLPLRNSTGSAAFGASRDMPDFRSMLRFAKNFVTRGEK